MMSRCFLWRCLQTRIVPRRGSYSKQYRRSFSTPLQRAFRVRFGLGLRGLVLMESGSSVGLEHSPGESWGCLAALVGSVFGRRHHVNQWGDVRRFGVDLGGGMRNPFPVHRHVFLVHGSPYSQG